MGWPDDREQVDSVFGGALAGMFQVAVGGDAGGGQWEAWLDPHDPSKAARLIERPPPGHGGMIQLGTFSRGGELAVAIGGSHNRDRSRVHQTFAASTRPDATRVVVDDGGGRPLVELTDIGLHPDQHTRLFAGCTASVPGPMTVTAYNKDGSELAHQHVRDR